VSEPACTRFLVLDRIAPFSLCMVVHNEVQKLMTETVKRGWWSRNWKWAVPLGCSLPILACAGFIVFVVSLTFGVMKSSDAYKDAVARARASAAVTTALGTPLEEGFFVSGEVNVRNGSGQADLEIPISGPKGSGVIHAVGVKTGGKWDYTTLEVEVKQTGARINLLANE